MNRASRVLVLSLACALAACGKSPSPGSTGGQAGAPATGGTAGLATGGAGSGGGAGATSSNGGAGASGGVAAGGSGGAPGTRDASADVAPASDAGNDVPVEAGTVACPAGAVICDDFEKYASGTTNLSPDWITYTYSGAVHVDGTKPRGGKQSLHLTTVAGNHHYAELLREMRGQAILPLKHFGRLMVWISAVPPSSHWNLNMASGPMKGAPEEVAKFLEGGMFGKLMSNYAQRGRIMMNGVYPPRGGGPETGDPGADADCAVAAPTQTIAGGKWVCWEWEFDGTADTALLWVDGKPMTEIDALGSGKQCQGPGFMGRKMMASYRWESPSVWDKVFIGWEQYQDTPANEVWIDDVALGPDRVGCLPP
jgi:hypothetical protein